MERISVKRKKFTASAGREFQVTYFTVQGTAPGPVLTLIAGQHGMEHSGPNLLPELMTELAGKEFAGTVHICPCANPPALEIDYEFYPENEDLSKINDYYYSIFRHYYCAWNLGRQDGETPYNMNRLWNKPDAPGVAGEITRWLWREICADANIILDMHSLQAEKPLIFNNFERNNLLTRYMGIEAIFMNSENPSPYRSGNLTYQGSLQPHHHAICIEFSRQHGLKESEYELGKQCVRNVMIGANMTPGEVILKKPVWKIPFGTTWHPVKAEHSGHIRYLFELYDYVKAGDPVFEIRDIETIELLQTAVAPRDGLLCNITHHPVIKPDIVPCYVIPAELVSPAGQILPKLPEDFFGVKYK